MFDTTATACKGCAQQGLWAEQSEWQPEQSHADKSHADKSHAEQSQAEASFTLTSTTAERSSTYVDTPDKSTTATTPETSKISVAIAFL